MRVDFSRRDVVQGAVVASASLALPCGAEGQTQPKVQPAASGDLSMDITGKLSQDYTFGVSWSLRNITQGDFPFLGTDGARHVLTMPYNFERAVYHLYQDPTTATGWTFDKKPLPNVMLPGVSFTAVFVPGDESRLLIYQKFSITYYPIDAKGHLGEANITARQVVTVPLVTGVLPFGTRYIPERPDFNRNFRETYTPPHSGEPVLRDARFPWIVKYVDPNLFANSQKLLPVAGAGDDFYKCISLNDDGSVEWLVLAVDQSDHAVLRDRQRIGNSKNGCVHVHEPADGKVEVVFADTDGVKTYSGAYDLRSGAPAKWSGPTVASIPAFNALPPSKWPIRFHSFWNSRTGAIDAYFALFTGTGDSDPVQNVFAFTDLYWARRGADGKWGALALIETDCDAIDVYPDGHLLTCRAGVGLEIREPSAPGSKPQHVFVQRKGDSHFETSSYRLRVKLSRGGRALANEPVGIATTHPVVAEINGAHATPGQSVPLIAKTDATGTISVAIFSPDRLTFPTLILTHPSMDQRLCLDLNQRVRDRISNLSAQRLMDAVDPVDRSPLLTANRDAAGDVSAAIRNIGTNAPRPAPGIGAPARVSVQSPIPVNWVAAAAPLAAAAPRPSGVGSTFAVNGTGQPKLTTLSQAQVQAAIAAENARSNGGNFFSKIGDFFTDAFEFVKGIASAALDLASSVYSAVKAGIANVVNVIIDGVKITLTLMVKGLVYIYEGVLETISQVMKALAFLLDVVGMVAGKFMRWLLDLLFDWEAILQKRNEVRDFLAQGLARVPSFVADPKGLTSTLTGGLQSVRAALSEYAPSSGSAGKPLPIPALGASIALPNIPDQTQWLLDKLQGLVNAFVPSMGLPSFATGVNAERIVQMASRASALGPDLAETVNVFQSFVSGGIALNDLPRAMLGAVAKVLDRLLEVLSDFLDAIGDVLHDIWANPLRLVSWLDTELPIPGFRTFYEALFEKPLSAYDLMCSMVAIGMVATGNKDKRLGEIAPGQQPLIIKTSATRRDLLAGPSLAVLSLAQAQTPAADPSGAHVAATVFSAIGVATNVLDSIATAAAGPGDKLSKITTVANLAATIGLQVSHIAEDSAYWKLAPGILAGVGLAILYLSPQMEPVRPQITCLATVALLGYHLFEIVDHKDDPSFLADSILASLQDLASLALRVHKGNLVGQSRPAAPQWILYYPTFQMTLSTTRFGGYLAR
jgi:hypothetical protein